MRNQPVCRSCLVRSTYELPFLLTNLHKNIVDNALTSENG